MTEKRLQKYLPDSIHVLTILEDGQTQISLYYHPMNKTYFVVNVDDDGSFNEAHAIQDGKVIK